MDRRHRWIAGVLLAGAVVAGCVKPPEPATAPQVEAVAVQQEAAESLVPPVLVIREAVEAALPVAAMEPDTTIEPVHPAAVALIVKYEVSSPAYYTARLQSPVWPKGQSGVTWCIGYDGGHQTKTAIETDWREHAAVGRLSATSGIIGPPAKALVATLQDIKTPYPYCERVFVESTLPIYESMAARLFSNGWTELHPLAKGLLTNMALNRGTSTRGKRRDEVRILRDDCVPRADYLCMATQFRSMKRLWGDTPDDVGLPRRYEETARLAESIGAGA